MKLNPGAHGFHITFDNGYVLSVQYGEGNYCDNKNWNGSWNTKHEELDETSTCEIAIWTVSEPALMELINDTVEGWVPISLIPLIMQDLQESKFEQVIRRLKFAKAEQ